MFIRVATSSVLLMTMWLILSGHYTVLLVSLGVASSIGVSLIGERMGLLDKEGLPLRILVRLPVKTLWLISEILSSNIDVIAVILDPSRASPTKVSVKATQVTAAGLVTHANFITLTPGTVAVQVNEKRRTIAVHGLTQDLADSTLDGSMDSHVTWLEGNSPRLETDGGR
jgi:multicomponent Na+:H+ antiporter subunit E